MKPTEVRPWSKRGLKHHQWVDDTAHIDVRQFGTSSYLSCDIQMKMTQARFPPDEIAKKCCIK